jgi:hypothetical protein
MNWDATGAVGEILGAPAVPVTLNYMAIQVRQNTLQRKREELISIQQGQNAVVSHMQEPRLFGAYVSTAEDRLTSIEDRGTSFSRVVQYLNHFQIVQQFHQTGNLVFHSEVRELNDCRFNNSDNPVTPGKEKSGRFCLVDHDGHPSWRYRITELCGPMDTPKSI